ncbi:MAG TPA: T9SS type A sorting domain-containing protein, partial [Rhodothermia bacterium]
SGTYTNEQGGSTAGLGRRRTRFVPQNPDGSWPAAWEFEAENFQPTGNLPFEENPAVTTAIEPIGSEIPNAISLGDNYPNPFNPSTTFEYGINATSRVHLAVYDMTGRLVRTLVDGVQPAANYRVSFNAGDLASGVYVYQLETSDRTISKRMVLLK